MKSNAALEFSGFGNLDIGSPRLAGSVKQVETGWDVVAGGADIWETSDQFHFVQKQVAGDFDMAVRVESFAPAHLYSKAGLMIRESLSPDSAHLMFVVFSDNSPRNNNLGAYEMQFRSVAGGACQAVYPAVRPPAPPEFPAAYPIFGLCLKGRERLEGVCGAGVEAGAASLCWAGAQLAQPRSCGDGSVS